MPAWAGNQQSCFNLDGFNPELGRAEARRGEICELRLRVSGRFPAAGDFAGFQRCFCEFCATLVIPITK